LKPYKSQNGIFKENIIAINDIYIVYDSGQTAEAVMAVANWFR